MYPRYLGNFMSQKPDLIKTDILIIGSGIAGIYAALNIPENLKVILLSKTALVEGNTRYAQGGIAAALNENDSPEEHYHDTLIAGAGKCNKKAVNVLVNEGPIHVNNIIKLGVAFDRKDNQLCFTVEGAHSKPRVLHAGGDTTGLTINSTLAGKVKIRSSIQIIEQAFAVDLLLSKGKATGALVLDQQGKLLVIHAGATILATGGAGRIYGITTNPAEATGDGVAMALRAGAKVKDLEYVQFHPTALSHPAAPGYLISEAVRGEGAVLINEEGKRFMQGHHFLGELAPRDIVSRGIHHEIYEAGKKVYLDATAFSESFFSSRFPSIYSTLTSMGINPAKTLIPVAPAAHYMMGGIKTDLDGRTNISRLYACGETASTGVHGANRLASNSLLEGLVFGFRAAKAAVEEYTPPGKWAVPEIEEKALPLPGEDVISDYTASLHNLMDKNVGIIRNAAGLKLAIKKIGEMIFQTPVIEAERSFMELQNQLIVAHNVAKSALANKESCGAHYRSDT
jgi:L-aspartate oxidase